METTFMSIHNTSSHANILFASESIHDILGYHPHEVVGKSCFDYFHHHDVPMARQGHQRSVEQDRAAVLWYARIMTKGGGWVTCECVFTVAYNVLVACTSIYNGDEKSHQRQVEARRIQRIFSSPPRDPRYHMLDYLMPKFTSFLHPAVGQPLQAAIGEPRAVLILNRFSNLVPIMYATDSIYSVLGMNAEEIQGKSFYECIQENCLDDAIPCLDRAKANDSIAYLRFYYRNPRMMDVVNRSETDASHSSDSEDGGVQLSEDLLGDTGVPMEVMEDINSVSRKPSTPSWSIQGSVQSSSEGSTQANSRTNSGGSSDLEHDSANQVFDLQPRTQSDASSSSSPPSSGVQEGGNRRARSSTSPPVEPIELEAVISCSSDGLVVILRAIPLAQRTAPAHARGLFAAPWADDPIIPQNYQIPSNSSSGPSQTDFMTSIRDVAVFAWALTGINGNIAEFSQGTARGQAVPAEGFPTYDPRANVVNYLGPVNNARRIRARRHQRQRIRFTSGNQPSYGCSQEDEALKNQRTNCTDSNEFSATRNNFSDQVSVNGRARQGEWNGRMNGYADHLPPLTPTQPFLVQGAPSLEEIQLGTNEMTSRSIVNHVLGGESHPMRYM